MGVSIELMILACIYGPDIFHCISTIGCDCLLSRSPPIPVGVPSEIIEEVNLVTSHDLSVGIICR